MEDSNRYAVTKTRKYFTKLCKWLYFLGSPNFWFENYNFSKSTHKILHLHNIVSTVLVCFMIAQEWAAMFTQTNLNEKQRSDLFLFSLSHPLLFFNVLLLGYKKNQVREILLEFVKFKIVYNDLEVEKQMVKKANFYNTVLGFFFGSALVFYGLDGIAQVFTSPDATFTTIITAWPDVKDQSAIADVARAFFYICWWIFYFRITAFYLIVITTTICLSYQFRNICSYFESLNGIFDSNDSQEEKEWKYEEGFKIGVKLHADILNCFQKYQSICNTVFGSQVSMNVVVMVLLLLQMVDSQRSAANTFTIIVTLLSLLLGGTGCLMWNGGDITVEASHLSMAIYMSGWHHCHAKSSARIRKLLTVAMLISQKPVILKAYGVLPISYDSYVTIVKSSYSTFSVLY